MNENELPSYAVWRDLSHFVHQCHLSLRPGSPDSHTVWRFSDGFNLEADDSSRVSEEVVRFIRNTCRLLDPFGNRWSASQSTLDGMQPNEKDLIEYTDSRGASIRGVGLDRLAIAYELASRHHQEAGFLELHRNPWRNDMENILSFCSQTAQRRYEKATPQLTIAYYPESPAQEQEKNFGVLGTWLLEEYKALLRLCRDSHTVVVVKRGCVITDILDNQRFDPMRSGGRLAPVPPRLAHLQQLTLDDDRIPPAVFNLNSSASMEIFAKGKLLFRRVNNVWRFLSLGSALRTVETEIGQRGQSQVGRNLLTLAMDLADKGEGALLFLCDEPTDEVLEQVLLSGDGLIRDMDLPGLPFQELTVRTRFTQMVGSRRLSLANQPYRDITPLLRDLCSIDGATVFSYRGDLLGFGCLIQTDPDQPPQSGLRKEGARTAAAKRASEYGIAIKVSSDGDALLFMHGREWGALC